MKITVELNYYISFFIIITIVIHSFQKLPEIPLLDWIEFRWDQQILAIISKHLHFHNLKCLIALFMNLQFFLFLKHFLEEFDFKKDLLYCHSFYYLVYWYYSKWIFFCLGDKMILLIFFGVYLWFVMKNFLENHIKLHIIYFCW